ncbi:hypothetical protein [Wolbachia endosymbiont (group A) of Anthophora plumipes]|uniref:hypothetical protein n=1 Tax=Wolbachia endosymbiont (group A) of Anthophora plumipes TaxID=3066194 RepID=UPI00333F8F79
MWKSIKKFFKWIADHTGISWIARKISSGWKSGNKTNQAGGTSQPRSQVPSESQVNGTAINDIVIPEGANSPSALEEGFFDAEENQPWLPNSETTNSEAEQHTVGDDLSVNA